MKENKTVFQKLKVNDSIRSISLFVQFVLLVAVIILSICTLFVCELNLVLQSLVALLLFTMAYNNCKVFKRKGVTILYVLAGATILLTLVVK